MQLWRATLHSMAALLPSVLIQKLLQRPPLRGDRLKLTLIRLGVKRASHRVEFTQVDC
jgi:hypothetical protein